jgi:hypothetical protein
MMNASEPVKSKANRTGRLALQAVEESNRVELFQNAADPHCVLIIPRSLVRVQPPPPRSNGPARTHRLQNVPETCVTLLAERIFQWFEDSSLQIEVPQIIIHKADQPDIAPTSAQNSLYRKRVYGFWVKMRPDQLLIPTILDLDVYDVLLPVRRAGARSRGGCDQVNGIADNRKA